MKKFENTLILCRTKVGSDTPFILNEKTYSHTLREYEGRLLVDFDCGKSIRTTSIRYSEKIDAFSFYQTNSGSDYVFVEANTHSQVKVYSTSAQLTLPRGKQMTAIVDRDYNLVLKTWNEEWNIGKIQMAGYNNGIVNFYCSTGTIALSFVR